MIEVLRDVYKSVEFAGKNGCTRVSVGDRIAFLTEEGEEIKGTVTNLKGKGEKTKIEIVPEQGGKWEIYSVNTIEENSLEVVQAER